MIPLLAPRLQPLKSLYIVLSSLARKRMLCVWLDSVKMLKKILKRTSASRSGKRCAREGENGGCGRKGGGEGVERRRAALITIRMAGS